jgi:hypothetical protein
MKLSEVEIRNKLSDIEKKIKGKNDFTRADIQTALNQLRGYGYSPEYKKEKLTEMIRRTGVKEIGIRTTYTPREGLKETDKTNDFLKDIYSYIGVIER